jgi:hypothetical protein
MISSSILLIGIAVGAFVSLVSAAVGAIIGTSKGRPVAGAFYGLLLGPVGWLIFTRIGFVIEGIVAVLAGFVVASAIMMGMETANARVFFPGFAKMAEARDKEVIREVTANTPEGSAPDSREIALRRREVVRELLAGAPVGALLVVVLGWVLGSIAGGFVTTWIGRRSPVVHALGLGGLLTLAGIANNLMLPPPVWFWILSLIVFLPATYVGARLAPKKAVQPTVPAGAAV